METSGVFFMIPVDRNEVVGSKVFRARPFGHTRSLQCDRRRGESFASEGQETSVLR